MQVNNKVVVQRGLGMLSQQAASRIKFAKGYPDALLANQFAIFDCVILIEKERMCSNLCRQGTEGLVHKCSEGKTELEWSKLEKLPVFFS